jgi:hypothetical protein
MLRGSVGGVDAPGNARGSRAETTVAGTRRGRGGDPIALNDANPARVWFELMRPCYSPPILLCGDQDEFCFAHRRWRFAFVFDGFDGGRRGRDDGRRLTKDNLVLAAEQS